MNVWFYFDKMGFLLRRLPLRTKNDAVFLLAISLSFCSSSFLPINLTIKFHPQNDKCRFTDPDYHNNLDPQICICRFTDPKSDNFAIELIDLLVFWQGNNEV